MSSVNKPNELYGETGTEIRNTEIGHVIVNEYSKRALQESSEAAKNQNDDFYVASSVKTTENGSTIDEANNTMLILNENLVCKDEKDPNWNQKMKGLNATENSEREKGGNNTKEGNENIDNMNNTETFNATTSSVVNPLSGELGNAEHIDTVGSLQNEMNHNNITMPCPPKENFTNAGTLDMNNPVGTDSKKEYNTNTNAESEKTGEKANKEGGDNADNVDNVDNADKKEESMKDVFLKNIDHIRSVERGILNLTEEEFLYVCKTIESFGFRFIEVPLEKPLQERKSTGGSISKRQLNELKNLSSSLSNNIYTAGRRKSRKMYEEYYPSQIEIGKDAEDPEGVPLHMRTEGENYASGNYGTEYRMSNFCAPPFNRSGSSNIKTSEDEQYDMHNMGRDGGGGIRQYRKSGRDSGGGSSSNLGISNNNNSKGVGEENGEFIGSYGKEGNYAFQELSRKRQKGDMNGLNDMNEQYGYSGNGRRQFNKIDNSSSSSDNRRKKGGKRKRKKGANDWEEQCLKILNKLSRKESSNWFLKPVNPELDGVPDYLTVIRYPMDLETVEKKLRNNRYDNPYEWQQDVRQIFFNAFIYHKEKNAVWHDAYNLAKEFDKVIKENKELKRILEEYATNCNSLYLDMNKYREIMNEKHSIKKGGRHEGRDGRAGGSSSSDSSSSDSSSSSSSSSSSNSIYSMGVGGKDRNRLNKIPYAEGSGSRRRSVTHRRGGSSVTSYSQSQQQKKRTNKNRGRRNNNKGKASVVSRSNTNTNIHANTNTPPANNTNARGRKDSVTSIDSDLNFEPPNIGVVPDPPGVQKIGINDKGLNSQQIKTLVKNMKRLAPNQRRAALDMIQDDLGILAENHMFDRNFHFDTDLLSIEKQRRIFLYVNHMARINLEQYKSSLVSSEHAPRFSKANTSGGKGKICGKNVSNKNDLATGINTKHGINANATSSFERNRNNQVHPSSFSSSNSSSSSSSSSFSQTSSSSSSSDGNASDDSASCSSSSDESNSDVDNETDNSRTHSHNMTGSNYHLTMDSKQGSFSRQTNERGYGKGGRNYAGGGKGSSVGILPQYKPVDESRRNLEIREDVMGMGMHTDFLGSIETPKCQKKMLENTETAWPEWKGQVIQQAILTQHQSKTPINKKELIAEGYDAKI